MAPKRARGKLKADDTQRGCRSATRCANKATIYQADDTQRGCRSASSARTKQKTEVSFTEEDLVKLWASVGKARDLPSDGEIARVLLNVYFNAKPKETQPTQLCQYCRSPLTLWCAACKLSPPHKTLPPAFASQPPLHESHTTAPASVKTERPSLPRNCSENRPTAKERGDNPGRGTSAEGVLGRENNAEVRTVNSFIVGVTGGGKVCDGQDPPPGRSSDDASPGRSGGKEGVWPGSYYNGGDVSDNAAAKAENSHDDEEEEEDDEQEEEAEEDSNDDADEDEDEEEEDSDDGQEMDDEDKDKNEETKSIAAAPQNEDDAYFCPYCSQVISGLVHRAHMLTHFEETNSLTCLACSKTCAFPHTLYNHIAIPMSQLKCGECGYVSATRCQTSKHAKEHQKARERFCQACDRTFPDMTKKDFNRHRAGHALKAKPAAPPEQFLCPECGKTFRKKRDLKMHLTYHNKESPFPCSLCDKAFKNKACLQQHELHHREKTQQCEVCGAKFFRKAGLRRHEQKHTGRKFQCSECGRQFSSKWDLHKHTELVHQGIRRFQCSVCAMKFYDKGHLQTHMRTHTGETPFHCDQCPAKFKLLEALKKHKVRHSGVKPYVCEDCGQVYSCEHSFKKHKQKYHSDSVYPCSHCPQVFVLQKSLDFHRRMCHTGSQEGPEVRSLEVKMIDGAFLDGQFVDALM